MKTKEAMQRFADKVTQEYGVPPVKVSLRKLIEQRESGMVSGRTIYADATILICSESPVIDDTIRHELAHWVAFNKEPKMAHRHNRHWRKWARRLGAHPRAKILREG